MFAARYGKFDATHPTPSTARDVFFEGERYARTGIETAWLLLDGGTDSAARCVAVHGMRDEGWSHYQAVSYVEAAMAWTGNVVPGPAGP